MVLIATESSKTSFPHAQTLLAVSSKVSTKNGSRTPETRYFISSLSTTEKSPQEWLHLIRGHWAGVENRNHWRKDACLLEDKTRSKNPHIVANLILLRNALYKIFLHFNPDNSGLPAIVEQFHANPSLPLNLILKKL